MVKTKVKKKTPEESSSSDNRVSRRVSDSSNDSSSSQSVLLPLICLLLIIVVVLQVVALLGSDGSSGSVSSSEIRDIQEKVTRLDTFFQNNIPEYGAGEPEELSPEDFPVIARPDISNRPTKGLDSAPITIVEYSDFECPFCGRFYQTTYPTLLEYVESGDAKFVFKDFPLSFHRLAEPAAIASKCVFRDLGDDTFYEYHDMIFDNQQQLSEENLKVWALEVGMGSSAYDECIQDESIAAQVQADFGEGQQIGVTGTPSVALNDKLIVGACPAETFDQAIALELESTPFFVEECRVITA